MAKKELSESEEKAVEKAHASAIGVFRVDSMGGETLERVYSIEEHGEEFQRLAQSRCDKINNVYKQKAVLREIK
jgi:hypothetical protein